MCSRHVFEFRGAGRGTAQGAKTPWADAENTSGMPPGHEEFVSIAADDSEVEDVSLSGSRRHEAVQDMLQEQKGTIQDMLQLIAR